MDKFTEKLETFVMPLAEKVSTNKSLQAVMGGFMTILPITMMGAIFTLLASLQIKPYQDFIVSVGLKGIFNFVPGVTTGMLAVYAVYSIAKSLMENLGHPKHANIVGALTLFAFLLIIPLGVSGVAKESQEAVTIAAALNTKFLGAAGVFTAILLGLVVPRIYALFIDHNWVIKMPDGVPPMIANSFSGLLPAFAIAILFALIRYGASLTDYKDVNTFIYALIQTPLRSMAASPLTFMLALFLVSTFWFFGIHGGMVVTPIVTALYAPLSLENLAAFAAGTPLPHTIVQTDWFIFGMIGGGGATLGFAIWMAFFAKSKRYKSLGRLALPASLCGINEPITFGTPVVMNPIMMLPFMVTPLINFGISYILRVANIIGPLNGVEIPTGTPVLFSASLTGGWAVVVLQAVLIVIDFFLYMPFGRMLDKKALAEEAAE